MHLFRHVPKTLSFAGLSSSLVFIPASAPFWVSAAYGDDEPAGRVVISTGSNEIERADGSIELLKTRSHIYSGDTIRTGKKGRIHIRFSDDSTLSLKPDSEFSINDYRFKQESSSNGNADYSLLKGGMRKLTGLIGKKKQESYQVRTSVATIGIRGTSYKAVLVSADDN